MSLKMKQTNAITTASRLLLKFFFLIVSRKPATDIIVGDEICIWFWTIAKGELPMERVNTEKVEYT